MLFEKCRTLGNWPAALWFSKRLRSDQGSAVIEFVVLAILVMVPMALGAVTVSHVHGASFGTVSAAREATRAFVTSDSATQARSRAQSAANLAMADHGFPSPVISVECLEGACLSPGSRVRIEVIHRVQLPLVPSSDGGTMGSFPVSAVHESVVDTFRSS